MVVLQYLKSSGLKMKGRNLLKSKDRLILEPGTNEWYGCYEYCTADMTIDYQFALL